MAEEDEELAESADPPVPRPGEKLARAIQGGHEGDAVVEAGPRARANQDKLTGLAAGGQMGRAATTGLGPTGRPVGEAAEDETPET